MKRRLFIAEKPSQAETLAKVLGDARRQRTHWDSAGGKVAGMAGHMLRALEPDEMQPDAWGSPWRFDRLPMLPEGLKYVPDKDRKARLGEIGELLRECDEVVIATDGGMEGEVIGREVLEHFKWRGPVSRLWLGAMTDGAVRKALEKMRRGEETVRYYYAGLARSEADWLVGMNGTRGLTLKSPRSAGTVSVGRVQTPTVAMVVRRDREIKAFQAQDYFEVSIFIVTEPNAGVGRTAVLRYAPGDEERILDRAKAEALAAKARGVTGPIKVESEKGKHTKPPAPFDLTTLQRLASKAFKWKPKHTLEIAQALYETHKAITYPRTDCKYIDDDAAAEAPALSRALVALPELAYLQGQTFAPGVWFNSKKVEGHDHDAMRPTENVPILASLGEQERKLYLMIAVRYLAGLMTDYVYDAVKFSLEIEDTVYQASGTTPVSAGWKAAYGKGELASEEEDGEAEGETAKLPNLRDGEPVTVMNSTVEAKKTKPPRRYTLADLLRDMENVAKFVSDPALRKILNSEDDKRKGIGTPATRGDVIDDIIRRGYIEEVGKSEIEATAKAHGLIALLEKSLPALADPAETALWQIELDKIKEGASPAAFLADIRQRWREYIAILARVDEKALAATMGIVIRGTGVFIPAYEAGGTPVELVDHGDCFLAAGWPGKFFAEIAGRKMKPEEYKQLVEAAGAPCGPFDGFVSKAKKKYAMQLSFDRTALPYPKVNFHFLEDKGGGANGGAPAKPTGVQTKHGEILDAGDRYKFGKLEGAWVSKKYFGREVTPEELGAVIAAGKAGHELGNLTSGRGAKFSVKTRLLTKPYAKLEAIFD